MTTKTKTFLLAASLLAFTTSACDDDDTSSGTPDASGSDASMMPGADGGLPDAPGDTNVSPTDVNVGDGGGDTAQMNSACAPADPSTYPAAMFAANTAGEKAFVDKLKALNKAMQDAETVLTAKVTRPQLDALFSDGANSLKTITSAYYAAQIEAEGAIFDEYVVASDNATFSPGVSPGLYTAHVFNAKGLDLRQMVEKALFSAALYKRMAEISRQATVTPADVDRMLAIMGGAPAFPNDAMLDDVVAKYAKRRSVTTDSNSLYLQLKRDFIAARAAAANPSVCATELTGALARIRLGWEKSLVATTWNYVFIAKTALATAMTDAQKNTVLHALGEGIGFTLGLRGLPASDRTITDAQIDEIVLELFAVPAGTEVKVTNATPYKFITDSAGNILRLDTVMNKIKSVYNFSDADLETFKANR